jgi:hypothetical protein
MLDVLFNKTSKQLSDATGASVGKAEGGTRKAHATKAQKQVRFGIRFQAEALGDIS